jgi:hypothetical protein
MLALVTAGRYSHLSLKGCLALEQYLVVHGRVSQQAHQMAPVTYSHSKKLLASDENQEMFIAFGQKQLGFGSSPRRQVAIVGLTMPLAPSGVPVDSLFHVQLTTVLKPDVLLV